jgi:hypothetical protein
MTDEFPRRRCDRATAGGLRWVAIWCYALTSYGLCHDGTSPGEFGLLLVLGAILLPFLVLADWIARGAPQVDADV